MNISYHFYNRPELVAKQFDLLTKVASKEKIDFIQITVDGPKPLDEEKNKQVKLEIEKHLPKNIECRKIFRETNHGSYKSTSGAISEFFDQVDSGIIIEDDVIPSESLFPYMNEMLEKYKNDTRIAMISGYQTVPCVKKLNTSYYFSPIGFTWGWATWSRVWNSMDLKLNDYLEKTESICFSSWYLSKIQGKSWKKKFDKMYRLGLKNDFDGVGQHWDRKFNLHMLLNSQFSISPKYNLVQNIGYGGSATHTKRKNKFAHNVKFSQDNIFPIIHTKNVSLNSNLVKNDLKKRFPVGISYFITTIKSML